MTIPLNDEACAIAFSTSVCFASLLLHSQSAVVATKEEEVFHKARLGPLVVEAHRIGQQIKRSPEIIAGTARCWEDPRKSLGLLQHHLHEELPVRVGDFSFDFAGDIDQMLEMELQELHERLVHRNACVLFMADDSTAPAASPLFAIVWFPPAATATSKYLLYFCPGKIKIVRNTSELFKRIKEELAQEQQLFRVWALFERELNQKANMVSGPSAKADIPVVKHRFPPEPQTDVEPVHSRDPQETTPSVVETHRQVQIEEIGGYQLDADPVGGLENIRADNSLSQLQREGTTVNPNTEHEHDTPKPLMQLGEVRTSEAAMSPKYELANSGSIQVKEPAITRTATSRHLFKIKVVLAEPSASDHNNFRYDRRQVDAPAKNNQEDPETPKTECEQINEPPAVQACLVVPDYPPTVTEPCDMMDMNQNTDPPSEMELTGGYEDGPHDCVSKVTQDHLSKLEQDQKHPVTWVVSENPFVFAHCSLPTATKEPSEADKCSSQMVVSPFCRSLGGSRLRLSERVWWEFAYQINQVRYQEQDSGKLPTKCRRRRSVSIDLKPASQARHLVSVVSPQRNELPFAPPERKTLSAFARLKVRTALVDAERSCSLQLNGGNPTTNGHQSPPHLAFGQTPLIPTGSSRKRESCDLDISSISRSRSCETVLHRQDLTPRSPLKSSIAENDNLAENRVREVSPGHRPVKKEEREALTSADKREKCGNHVVKVLENTNETLLITKAQWSARTSEQNPSRNDSQQVPTNVDHIADFVLDNIVGRSPEPTLFSKPQKHTTTATGTQRSVAAFVPLEDAIADNDKDPRQERLDGLRRKKLGQIQQARNNTKKQLDKRSQVPNLSPNDPQTSNPSLQVTDRVAVVSPIAPSAIGRPKKPSNRRLIQNAIEFTVLAGGSCEKERKAALQLLTESRCNNFVILLKSAKELKFRALYEHHLDRNQVIRIFSVVSSDFAPVMLSPEVINQFFRYNTGKKEFVPVETRCFTLKTDAASLLDELVFKKKSVIWSKT